MHKATKILAEVTPSEVVLFGFLILAVFVLLFIAFIINSRINRNDSAKSPYSGFPLRFGENLPFESKKKILQFLFNKAQYDNRIFELSKAGFCRETGRIFPNCKNWYGKLQMDWNFLQKRYPGNYVSWGSLSDVQQAEIRAAHRSLEDFQTEESSPSPAPSAIEPEYKFTIPGPLYVDINTKILLGWQRVPDTVFEVLIVQKPKHKFDL